MNKRIATLAAVAAMCVTAPGALAGGGPINSGQPIANQGPARSPWRSNQFQLPSRNIFCKFRPAYDRLTCGTYSDQVILSMTSTSSATNGRYLSAPVGFLPTLAYGTKWTADAARITCRSAFNGLRCTNYQGHGFFLARGVANAW